MAFVFRSQKQSFFDIKKQEPLTQKLQTISNQQSQLNGTVYTASPQKNNQKSPGKLLKGLPSLLRKDKTTQPNILSFQKQNSLYEQNKTQLKFSLQKLKRATQNYFFSSKVPRNVDLIPLKSLNNNLTCTQFSTDVNKINSSSQSKKQILSNHTASTFIVNRNLNNSQSVKDVRKIFNQNLSKNLSTQKILVNFQNQLNGQFKRKSSPPQNLQKTNYHIAIKKIKELKQINRQKTVENQSQIFMKTLNQSDNSTLKKHCTQKKLMKLHKGNLQSSFYKEQESQQLQTQEDIPYESDIPGPGTYENTNNLKDKRSFRSKKQKFAKIFVSPLQRFKNDQVKFQEITYVNQSKPQKLYPSHFFTSKTPKNLQLQYRNNSPPLGSYNTRESIEHDVVKNLLKSSNIPNFNSSMPRFKYPKTQELPGPGFYNIQAMEKARQQEIKNQLSSSYKSQVKRCEDFKASRQNHQKNTTIDIIGDKQDEEVVIHKRQQHFDSSEFFSPPPFFSSVERFPESKNINMGSDLFMKVDKNSQNQEIKNSQPFNSTAKRILNETVGDGVGVGSYLVQKDRWNKKSYNVNFH